MAKFDMLFLGRKPGQKKCSGCLSYYPLYEEKCPVCGKFNPNYNAKLTKEEVKKKQIINRLIFAICFVAVVAGICLFEVAYYTNGNDIDTYYYCEKDDTYYYYTHKAHKNDQGSYYSSSSDPYQWWAFDKGINEYVLVLETPKFNKRPNGYSKGDFIKEEGCFGYDKYDEFLESPYCFSYSYYYK